MSHSESRGRWASRAAACELRAAVARKQVTLTALSAATGIPRTTLARKLRGESDLTVAELIGLATALEVPAADLLEAGLSPAPPAGRPPGRRRPRRP